MILEDRIIVGLVCVAAAFALARVSLVYGRRRSIVASVLSAAYVLGSTVLDFERPSPLPPGVGLDPSWTIGIARAAKDHFVFGKDIVFSYGPLGYLMLPIADVGNTCVMAAMQLAVLVLLFATVLECANATTSRFQKCLIIALAPLVVSVIPPDILSIVLVLLAFALRVRPREFETLDMLALGVFGGIFALTKFTMAIDIGLVATTFFLARAWACRCDSVIARQNVLGAAAFASGAIGMSEYKFLSLDVGIAGALIVLVAALGAAAGTATWYRFGKRNSLVRRAATTGVVVCASLVFVSAIASPAYRTFVTTYVLLAEGYSAAHAFEGPAWQLFGALWWLCGLLVVAWSMRNQESAPLAFALVAFEWAIFKLGFVRQDLHVVNFYAGSALSALLLAFAARRKQSLVAALMLLVSIEIPLERVYADAGWGSIAARLSVAAAASNVDTILHLRQYSDVVDRTDFLNVRADLLPAGMVRAIGTRPVDAAPVETGFVFANDLTWDPEPIFQTIMAYSPKLDAIDRESLEHRRGDAIIYSLGSMDDRMPNGDQPSTFAFMLCHYVLSAASSERPAGPVLLLRTQRSRCGEEKNGVFREIAWNEAVAIPREAGMTFARIRILPNLAGRALTAAFRSPLVYVTVGFDDGSSSRYRVVVGTGIDGVLVNPVTRNSPELAKLFSGDLPSNVRTLRFETATRWFHSPQIAFDSLAVRR